MGALGNRDCLKVRVHAKGSPAVVALLPRTEPSLRSGIREENPQPEVAKKSVSTPSSLILEGTLGSRMGPGEARMAPTNLDGSETPPSQAPKSTPKALFGALSAMGSRALLHGGQDRKSIRQAPHQRWCKFQVTRRCARGSSWNSCHDSSTRNITVAVFKLLRSNCYLAIIATSVCYPRSKDITY